MNSSRLLFLSCALGLLACSSPSTRDSEPTAAYQLTVLEQKPCPLPPGVDPKKTQLLGVRVRLVSHEASGIPANYFYASVLTTDGSRYLAEHPGCSPLLSGRPLFPGQIAEGYLNFPLPLEKTPETLVYAPILEGQNERESTREISLRAAR